MLVPWTRMLPAGGLGYSTVLCYFAACLVVNATINAQSATFQPSKHMLTTDMHAAIAAWAKLA